MRAGLSHPGFLVGYVFFSVSLLDIELLPQNFCNGVSPPLRQVTIQLILCDPQRRS